MKKQVYYLQDEPPEVENLITWLNYVGYEAIASGDLICLINEFYFPN
jgi:hypothetical protein